MSIKNPYPPVEYKVYNYTFLQSVEVNIKFASGNVSTPNYGVLMRDFLTKHYNLSNISGLDDGLIGRIKINANNKLIEFYYEDGNIGVKFDHGSYISFKTTAEPAIKIFIDYLQNILHIDTADISVKKVNAWPIELSDGDYRAALHYLFQNDFADGFPTLNAFDPQNSLTLNLSKETSFSIEDNAKLEAKIDVAFNDMKHFTVTLECITSAYRCLISELLSDVKSLNDIQFGFFHDSISQNVISIMEKEKQ